MFFRLVERNSRRDRKENGLFFSSLLVSIIAFYIILSLSHQDVMLFLAKMESQAVDRLLRMIPLFYCLTLFILFFLIYYAGKFRMEKRRHEFGVYLMLGMRRPKLFVMLLMEDFRNSLLALLVGVPAAVLLSELISLVTARFVGLGIIGHRFSFSPAAVLWTAVGFGLIKLAAFLLLSGRIVRRDIGDLLVDMPGGTKPLLPGPVYAGAVTLGILCLGTACGLAVSGLAWREVNWMGLTLFMGVLGTMLLFYGLRAVTGFLVRHGGKNRRLHVFHFRQIQETVILRSNLLAVSSLLICAALCCFGAGVAIARSYGGSGQHVMDYTFGGHWEDVESVWAALKKNHLEDQFSDLFEIRLGRSRFTQDHESAYQMDALMEALEAKPESQARDILLNNLSYTKAPYLISLSGYNHLLAAAGGTQLKLAPGEAVIYMDHEFVTLQQKELLDSILEEDPEVMLEEKPLYLTGEIQTVSLVTDRAIRISFALILPDEMFEYYTQGDYSVYLNGVLAVEEAGNGKLLSAISAMNEKLNGAGIRYESYLQNMGRQLFYMVAASYITIYLAVIFLIIANTVIGVQFLMGQQKSGRRYRTLIRLGADYGILCRFAGKQIGWYFGMPTAVAVINSLFGVRALFAGLLPYGTRGNMGEMMWVSTAMILALFVVEFIYIAAVRRGSSRYLLTLMVPEREE